MLTLCQSRGVRIRSGTGSAGAAVGPARPRHPEPRVSAILPLPPRFVGRAVALETVLSPDGLVTLTFEPGLEAHALAIAAAVDDATGLGVRDARLPGPPPRLRLVVGGRPPEPDEAPVLHWCPGRYACDTVVRLPDGAEAALGPLTLGGLGRAEFAGEGRVLLADAHGPLARATPGRVTLLADLPLARAEAILGHATARSDVRAVLTADLLLRRLLAELVPLPADHRPAASLVTVDAEDQQRYFLNREHRCSTVVGTPDDDMRFSVSCRTIMDRCEAEGLHAIFMVTGDELDPSFRDAFGDPLVGLDDNRRVLSEMEARGHGLACHGFDHEWWLSKGFSANPRMGTLEKLRYFLETSGSPAMLWGTARFLWRWRRELAAARARKIAREATVGTPFTVEEVLADLERWCALVGHRSDRLFIRYPGFVRSPAVLEALERRFSAVIDSSDLIEPDPPLPIRPYRLLAERDGVIRRTRITEIPCIFVDKTLRTRDRRRVDRHLDRLATIAAFPGSVLCFVTHTKVLGGTWGHCHLYLHDPTRGMALPMVEASWKAFARLLRERTVCLDTRGLELLLFGNDPWRAAA